MRLSVQGCLILLLCFFSSFSFASYGQGTYDTQAEAANACYAYANGPVSGIYESCTLVVNGASKMYRPVSGSGTLSSLSYNFLNSCEGDLLQDSTGDYYCSVSESPAECYENGLSYDNQTQQCVEVCEHGVLNGVCLNPPADNMDECTPETEGYKGYFDYGSNRRNVCETDNTCPGGVIGLVGGELQCVPNEYAPPECSGKEVLHVGEFGTYCALPNDAPEETQEPNTDTDGDGEPDEYRRENDPESVDKGLDKVADELGQANNELEGANNRLSAILDEIRAGNNANEGNGSAIEQGISSGIGSAGDSATGQLDDHIDGIDTTAPMTADDLSGVESTVSNLFGVSTQCTDIVFGTQELFYTITCQQMDKIRDLLGFLLYGFTVIRLFQIAVRPAAKGTP